MRDKESMIKVKCISERTGVVTQLKIGKKYMIDKNSIWIDCDGDSYGTVYDMFSRRIGVMKLSHFKF